ncbi:slowpoke-binding protein isoform X2 [Bacillus rossius redtenbacheri]|uniref:slowpoke-binding protein isoform X2 n=1 Tax=Bacillus rossius redtenbacheri TaxID=93214 RepID=UPI002FDE8210
MNILTGCLVRYGGRHGGRYQYTALEPDSSAQERVEMERKARERAQNACLHYLHARPRYTLLHHLNDIGSRVDKHWFVVRDTSVKTERLLTLVPRGAGCPIRCDAGTRDTILGLFLALQHPYIYPVLDLDFRDVGSQTYVILVLPFNNKGSLKDLIYKSRWQDDWGQKYGQRSAGLPLSQVQRLGRQILEALLFLKDRGFPPCGHVHSGNIILQNGVARLTGLENTLLGLTSRIHPVIWSRAREQPQAVDAICFGHVLFEMCAGYELCAPEPTQGHLLDIKDYPQIVEVLEFIFHGPHQRCPSVEELLLSDFFRNIDLREMRAAPLPQAFQARLTASTISLLNEIKRHQDGKRSRRSQSASTAENSSPKVRERKSEFRPTFREKKKLNLKTLKVHCRSDESVGERAWLVDGLSDDKSETEV